MLKYFARHVSFSLAFPFQICLSTFLIPFPIPPANNKIFIFSTQRQSNDREGCKKIKIEY